MNHHCLNAAYKMAKYDKPPHYFDSCLKDAPDGGEVIMTTLYMNEKDKTSIGWGMRFKFCPACGEKL